jgi:hypothetical protein
MNSAAFDRRGTLEALDRILNRGGDDDVVLRSALEALRARGIPFAALRDAEGKQLLAVPAAGTAARAVEVPVVYEEKRVGTLALAVDDRAFAERVATLISPHVRPCRV